MNTAVAEPTIIAVTGPRGAGKTTLAVNLAVALRHPTRTPTALVTGSTVADAVDLVSDDTVRTIVIDLSMEVKREPASWMSTFSGPRLMLDAATLPGLGAATAVLIVSNLYQLTTINDTRELVRFLANAGIDRRKCLAILNRISRQNRLPTSDIEETLGLKIAAQIPNDPILVPASVESGVPLVETDPACDVSRSIFDLASALVSSEAIA